MPIIFITEFIMYLFVVASLLTSVGSAYLYYRNLKINNRIAFLEKELDGRGVEYERDNRMCNAQYAAFLAFLIRIDNFTNILEIYMMAAGIDSNKHRKIMNNKYDFAQGLYHLSFVNAEDYMTVLNNTYFTVVKETINTMRLRTETRNDKAFKRFEMLVRRNAVDLTGAGADVHLPDVVPVVDEQNPAEEIKAVEENITEQQTNTVVSQSLKLSHKVHTDNKEFMDLPELEYDNNVADGQNNENGNTADGQNNGNNREPVDDNDNDENDECCTCGEEDNDQDSSQDNEQDNNTADEPDNEQDEKETEDQVVSASNVVDNNNTGHNCEYCSKTNDDNRFSDLAGSRPDEEDQPEEDENVDGQNEDETEDQPEDQESNSSSDSDAESGKGEPMYVNEYDMHVSKASDHLISVMRAVVNAYVFDDDIGFPCGCASMGNGPWADISDETNTLTHNNPFTNLPDNTTNSATNAPATNASTSDNGTPVFWTY